MKLRANNFRGKLSNAISGNVMELGPGQITFPAPNATKVTLVDKLPSDLHKELFPELGSDVYIVEPDLLVDFDKDGLIFSKSDSFDYVIASHLLEHLAQPFRMLDEIHRVLRIGGKAIIFLPDRRRTFDWKRGVETFEHFSSEYLDNDPEVSNTDLFDFLEKTENYFERDRESKFSQLHLSRSIHVHAWTDEEFIQLLSQMQNVANFNFRIILGVSSSLNSELEEFGIVLEKVKLNTAKNSDFDIKHAWKNCILISGSQNNLKKFILHFIPPKFHPLLVQIKRRKFRAWRQN
jgi:SAM-dependent methyltransferase